MKLLLYYIAFLGPFLSLYLLLTFDYIGTATFVIGLAAYIIYKPVLDFYKLRAQGVLPADTKWWQLYFSNYQVTHFKALYLK